MPHVKVFKIRLSEQYREEDESFLNDFIESVKVETLVPTLISSPQDMHWSVFVVYTELDEDKIPLAEKMLYDSGEALTPEEEHLLFRLKQWREGVAQRQNIPSYMVFHVSHLKTIVKVKPRSLEDFQKVKGLSRRKINKYAKDILRICEENL
jgi:superfamily II DNA helicase RecQ